MQVLANPTEKEGDWSFADDCDALERSAFASLEAIFSLSGEIVSQGPYNDCIRVQLSGRYYFVKRYRRAGSWLRLLLGQPRVRDEWRNLQRFAEWGIATPALLAWGLEERYGFFYRGALISREVSGCEDMATLAANGDPRLRDRQWLRAVLAQLAALARRMHAKGFAHGDLKWRNILVTDGPEPEVVLIDCPAGRIWRAPFLEYRLIKDLACLDKIGKYQLTRADRLRFYRDYLGRDRLDGRDKRRLRKVLRFFAGRE